MQRPETVTNFENTRWRLTQLTFGYLCNFVYLLCAWDYFDLCFQFKFDLQLLNMTLNLKCIIINGFSF